MGDTDDLSEFIKSLPPETRERNADVLGLKLSQGCPLCATPRHFKGKGSAKYHNVPTIAHNLTFQSGKEAARYNVLMLRQKAGEIVCLCCQVTFDITPPGAIIREIKYIADFVYIELPLFVPVVEDVKVEPTKTRVYRLKKKLFKAKYGIDITEVM